MPRLLTAVSFAAAVLCTVGCGGGGGGSDKAATKSEPAATPAAAAAGFVTQKGADWSYSRPESWQKAGSDDQEKGKEAAIFQSAPGTQGVPSQIGIGVASKYKDKLATAVKIARDINETRFKGYEIQKEGKIEVDGAEGYKIDATYDAYTDQPMKIRIVDIYVQTPGRRQMNFFVRGPETDLQEIGLDGLVNSFRVL